MEWPDSGVGVAGLVIGPAMILCGLARKRSVRRDYSRQR